MPHTIDTSLQDQLIVIRHTGEVPISECEEAAQAMDALADSGRYDRILVDVQQARTYPDRAELMQWVRGRKPLHAAIARVAFLTSDAHAAVMEFFALGARTEGKQAQAFRSEQDAMNWLRGS